MRISGQRLNLTTDGCWEVSEKPTLESNVARELAATVIKRSYALRRFRETEKLRVVKKLYERTKRKAAAKDPGFKK